MTEYFQKMTLKKDLFGENLKKKFHPQHLDPPGQEIRNKLIFNLGPIVTLFHYSKNNEHTLS